MNILFASIIIASYISGFINGNIGAVSSALFDGAKNGVNTVLAIAGVMCFWTGIMKAAEVSGISRIFEIMLKPVISLLFPKLKNEKAKEYITLNMSANLLGMGNAATPMGVKAMKELDDGSGEVNDDMCMFTVLNTASFQLIPSTVIALRAGAGSAEPFSILMCVWCTSICAVIIGVLSVKLFAAVSRAWQS